MQPRFTKSQRKTRASQSGAHVTQDLDATFDVTVAECGAGPIPAGGAERQRSLRLVAHGLPVRQFRPEGNLAA